MKSKIPTLKTSRLILRPFQLTDANEVQRQAGNKKIADMTAAIPHPYPDGAAELWISKHSEKYENKIEANWAVEAQEPGKLVGCVSLYIAKAHQKAELGFWIGEESWNNGFCSEASVEVIRFGFENMKLNKITARHVSENPASGKVLLKAGMEKEGYFKQDFLKNGKFVDMIVYGLLRQQFNGPVDSTLI